MTDQLDLLLADAADDLVRHIPIPPPGPLLARSRRHRLLRVTVPTIAVPVVLALAAAAVAAGPSWLLRGDTRTPAVAAHAAPELGTVPLPAEIRMKATAARPTDPPVTGPADLLATATTKDGLAQLFGFTTRSGSRCVAQDYQSAARPDAQQSWFCPPSGGIQLDRGPADHGPTPLTIFGGFLNGAPGDPDRPAPVTYGSAPPGTRTVEFTSAYLPTARADAHAAGAAYDNRAYYLLTWPQLVPTTVRALNAAGHELARMDSPDPSQLAAHCDDARWFLVNPLETAVDAGRDWARTHPQADDPVLLRTPTFVPGTPKGALSRQVATEPDVLARYQRAQQAGVVDRMGLEEMRGYRRGASIIVSDGAGCFSAELTSAAKAFITVSTAAAGPDPNVRTVPLHDVPPPPPPAS